MTKKDKEYDERNKKFVSIEQELRIKGRISLKTEQKRSHTRVKVDKKESRLGGQSGTGLARVEKDHGTLRAGRSSLV